MLIVKVEAGTYFFFDSRVSVFSFRVMEYWSYPGGPKPGGGKGMPGGKPGGRKPGGGGPGIPGGPPKGTGGLA